MKCPNTDCDIDFELTWSDEIIKWEKDNIKLGQSMIDKINKKIK